MATTTEEKPSLRDDVVASVSRMRALSVRALRRMYKRADRMFVFCIRRSAGGDAPEGVSRRYTAIVLIGLATEGDQAVAEALDGDDPSAVCGRLLDDVASVENLGDVALTLWAAALWKHPDGSRALDRLRALDPVRGAHPTVEVSWALTALAADRSVVGDDDLGRRVAQRLTNHFCSASRLFPHWLDGARPGGAGSLLRGHVCCFADLVYPTQALAYHSLATGDPMAATMAQSCADAMCEGQGGSGQWWWHFDVRTGRVVEGFPVYAVHQDAMAPMALFAAQQACGADYTPAIEKGVRWLMSSPELGGRSLIDADAGLIWRKVARHEPGKLSRGLQAAASSLHSSLRVAGLGAVFRPGRVDYECRPYHLGWLLHAWPQQRVQSWTQPHGS